MKSGLIVTLIFIILISTLAFSQKKIEENRLQKKEVMYFLPKKEHLPYTTIGFKPVMADMLWFRGVSYFLYHMNNDNNYPYLYGIFEASVSLDPQFKQVYRDTMTLLINDKEHYHEAEKLLLYGLSVMPDDWEINYLTGVLYQFYIKDSEKSLAYFEKAWGLMPRDQKHAGLLDNVNIMIRSITEKKNDKRGLILYWIDKYQNGHGKDSIDYAASQIIKYSSLYMEESLNQIYKLTLPEEEKQNMLNNEIAKWGLFSQKHQLNNLIKVPSDKLFASCDAYGYPWVYSEAQQKYYSYGYASDYLRRKISIYNTMLWEKAQDYLTLSVVDITSYAASERERFVILKPEFKEFPSLQKLIPDLRSFLKCEVVLLPKYNQAKCTFSVPTFEELSKIESQFR